MNKPARFLLLALIPSLVIGNEKTATRDGKRADAPVDANKLFHELVRKNAADQSSPPKVEGIGIPKLKEAVAEGCRYALHCISKIENNRSEQAKAYVVLAERLLDAGHPKEALEVIKLIPDYRRPIAAADFVLEMTRPGSAALSKDIDISAIIAKEIDDPPFALTFRHEGEVLLRKAQIAARQGNYEEVGAIYSRIRRYPTPEYVARAQARVGVEKVRQGGSIAFDELLDEETRKAVLSRTIPDFNLQVGKAQFEIAMILMKRAKTDGDREQARNRIRKSLDTAATSRVFYGELVVHCCEELSRHGEAKLAEEMFRRHASQIAGLANNVTVKPLILARIAPIHDEWSPDFDPKELLDAAREVAQLQHPLNRSRALAAIGSGWYALGEKEQAASSWNESLGLIPSMGNLRPRCIALAYLALEISANTEQFPETLREQLEKLKPS